MSCKSFSQSVSQSASFFFDERYPAYVGAGLLRGHRSGGGQSRADLARSLGIKSLGRMQALGSGVLLLGGGVRPNPARIQLSYGAARLLLCSATPIRSWGARRSECSRRPGGVEHLAIRSECSLGPRFTFICFWELISSSAQEIRGGEQGRRLWGCPVDDGRSPAASSPSCLLYIFAACN